MTVSTESTFRFQSTDILRANVADLLLNAPDNAWAHLLLTHGAGEAFDSPFLSAIAEGLEACGVRVTRFEFDYRAQVRHGASRRPPPKMPVLQEEFLNRIAACDQNEPLFIGGKSMGGRVASLVADEMFASGAVRGIVCLGYPFHPVGKPDTLRTAHLQNLAAPTLICQGTRDPFGTPEEVAGYDLSDQIEICWLEDGDHSFKPRKRSGLTQERNLAEAVEAITTFMRRVSA